MAKKKPASAVSKAQAIRDAWKKTPDAKGVEIVAALKAKGIDVTQAQVSNVKAAAQKKAGTNGQAKKTTGKRPWSTAEDLVFRVSVDYVADMLQQGRTQDAVAHMAFVMRTLEESVVVPFKD